MISKMPGFRCVYRNCNESRRQNPELSFFSFPCKPSPEDIERLRQWIERCGNSKLDHLTGDDLKTKSWRICARHFHEKDMYSSGRRKQLFRNAIPMNYRESIDSQHDAESIISDLKSCEFKTENGKPYSTSNVSSCLTPNTQDTNASWIPDETSITSSTEKFNDTPETSSLSHHSDNETENVVEAEISDYIKVEDMDQTSMENQSWDEEMEQSCITSEDERGDKSSRKESSTRNKRNPKSYYQNKKLREQGAAYLGRSKVDGVGTITYVAKGERKMKPPCISNFCTKSKKRFCNEFTEEDRLLNFNKFWNQTWEEKKADIMSLVVKTNSKQSRIHSSRTTTLKYFLYRKDGLRYAVCQKFFCNTLSIVNTTVVRWIESEQSQVKRNTKAQHSTKEASVTSEERRIPEEQKMNANQADNISQFSQSQAVSTMERATHFMHQFCSSGDQLPEETTFDYNDNFEEDSSVNHLPAIPEFVSLPLPSEITTKYGPAGFSTVQRQQVQELSNPSECKKKTGVKRKEVTSTITSPPNVLPNTTCETRLLTTVLPSPHLESARVSTPRGFFGASSIKENQELFDLTGVTVEVFAHLLNLLSKCLVPSADSHKVDIKDCLLIFLIKMRHGHTDIALAVLFGLNSKEISSIFKDVLNALYTKTFLGYIVWPSKRAINLIMPDVFKKHHPKIRAIVDFIKIVTSDDFLIGITPSGLVCYKSKTLSTEHNSKVFETLREAKTNFCKMIEPRDEVLSCSDSFTLTNKNGTVNYDFKNVRDIVNQSVQRVKDYSILTKFPPQLRPHINEIMHMACVLVNLQTCQ